MSIDDQIRKGFRVYDLKEILGEKPMPYEVDSFLETLGPDKYGEVDEKGLLYVKTDTRWTILFGDIK